MTDFDELLHSIPRGLEPYLNLPDDGGRLEVYNGTLSIIVSGQAFLFSGQIFYTFSDRVKLRLIANSSDPGFYFTGGYAELIVSKQYCGKVFINRIHLADEIVTVYGEVQLFQSVNMSPCCNWRWCYLNLDSVFGELVSHGRMISPDRLTFIAGGYKIFLENARHANKGDNTSVRYVSTICQLSRTDESPCSLEDALKVILDFSLFISFAFGKRFAPFFIEGVDRSGSIYLYHQVRTDCGQIGVDRWAPDHKEKDLSALWPLFWERLHLSDDERDVLNTSIHWYLEANMNSGMLEGAYILGMTGLELMYNVLVGKKNSIENKIRALVDLVKLKAPILASDIAEMRNCLVHYGAENRNQYSLLSLEDKRLRMDTVLHILELSILYWLGYCGHFRDRMRVSKSKGSGVKCVPWQCQQ